MKTLNDILKSQLSHGGLIFYTHIVDAIPVCMICDRRGGKPCVDGFRGREYRYPLVVDKMWKT